MLVLKIYKVQLKRRLSFMSVTEAVREIKRTGFGTKRKKQVKTVSGYIGYFALGLAFGFSGLGESFSPFGAAFVSASGKKYMLTSAAGASLGYILSTSSVNSLRYVASILALIVVLGALKPFRAVRDNPLTPVISTFVCLLVTGLAIAFSGEIALSGLLVCFSEAVLGGAASYLFIKTYSIISVRGSFLSLTSKEATALVISVMLLLLSIKNISFASVYPAHILTALLVLICSYYGKEAGGAIFGVCGGITMSFGTGNIFLLSFYAFGGLLSGVFSNLGKIASFAAFVFAGAGVSVIAYGTINNYEIFIEAIAAGICFLLLPKGVKNKLDDVLSPSVNSPIIDSVKNDIARKLHRASEISAEICGSLTTVNDALIKTDRADIQSISKKAKESVCGSCGLFDTCWQESFSETVDCFNTLILMKKEGKYLDFKNVPINFSSRCIRTEMIASAFNKLYSEYKIKERMESRINEIYSLAAYQFVNVSALLDSLCDKMDENVLFDMDTAAKAKNTAAVCGFTPLNCCSVINSLGKMSLELTVKKPSGKIEVSSLTRQLEVMSNRRFDLPEITRDDETTTFLYKERPDFRITSSGVQLSGSSEKYSGDTFSTFTDDDGFYYAVICDGMGTGLRAALSSNLAVSLLEKLLKAGFGAEAAIKTVNTSLISKSGDECSVTLDLTVIDTFTGHVDFFKCGASDTLVRKNGKVLTVSSPSLPLGILKDIEYSYGTGTLTDGDVIVMSSDGVRDEDLTEIKPELKAYKGDNLRAFTTALAENACRNQPERNDDLTLLSLAVSGNDI